ncbi:hypothetical protein [Planctellipticum variicoloris]|uniref:hypothetical protein n=1 Tax=Planctellipticum variicoloris TaxID=3064265 RepID=UPI0030133EC1|nr:hypothetical protein SH412_004552 [Planctomycetaceae bacterium SH412]
MWLMTTAGFFSVVEKPWDRDAGTLTVRSRVRADLDTLRAKYLPELGEIQEDPQADYRYRAQVPRDAFSQAAARLATDIDYDNFKNEVARQQGKARSSLYGEVWTVLNRLQSGKPG